MNHMKATWKGVRVEGEGKLGELEGPVGLIGGCPGLH